MKKPFLIPISFQLHGQTIHITWDKTLTALKDNRGEALPRLNEITLQQDSPSSPRPQSDVEQAFCHELVHFILMHMESKLFNDEKFVNLFGNLLHQAFVSAEYNKEKK